MSSPNNHVHFICNYIIYLVVFYFNLPYLNKISWPKWPISFIARAEQFRSFLRQPKYNLNLVIKHFISFTLLWNTFEGGRNSSWNIFKESVAGCTWKIVLRAEIEFDCVRQIRNWFRKSIDAIIPEVSYMVEIELGFIWPKEENIMWSLLNDILTLDRIMRFVYQSDQLFSINTW